MRGQGVDVLVVGAGIAGLSVARTLRSWGAAVQIVERAPGPQPHGAGIYLPGNAVRALDRLGLADQVAVRAVTVRRQRVSDRRGRRLFEMDVDDLWRGVGPCLALARADLHQVLLAGAKDVPIRWGCAPEAVTETSDGVRVRFSDASSAHFDLVVGADGVHSTVRRLVFGGPDARPIGQYAYRFLARVPDPAAVWSLMLGDRSAFLTIPVSAEQVYCYCDGPAADPPPPLRDLVGGYAEPVPTLADGWDAAGHAAPIEEVVLDRWSRGLVLLVGDAAHATSPNMAQGAAMAFEDAIVLARALATAGTIGDALAAYEKRRRPRTAWVLRQTRRREATRRLPAAVRDVAFRRTGRAMFRLHHRLLREDFE